MGDKYTQIQVRRIKDTAENLDTAAYANIVPAYGEFVFSHNKTTVGSDTVIKDVLVIGDGETTLPLLPRLRIEDLAKIGFDTLSINGNTLTVNANGIEKTTPVINSISNAVVGGTTAGPTISTSINGFTDVSGSSVTIPSASGNASGVVTTGVQTFAGNKTFNNDVTINGTLYATLNGNANTATVASKLGTSTVGNIIQPIYLNGGVATLCSTYAGGTKVTLNNANKGASDAGFYAPTSSGNADDFLKSNGANTAPTWVSASAIKTAIGAPKITVATSAPSSPVTGDMYFNSSTGVLQIYTGSAWKSVVGVWG